ncbi:MAG: TraB/GumN family protein [Rhodospirillales bacterium]|nr:TraB/GumN family protein [Rhodospirillales bacterium]
MKCFLGRLSVAFLTACAFVIVAGSGASTAADTGFGDVAVASDVPFANGRLWQVQKPGGPPSFVFGTIHVPDPRVEPVLGEVEEVLDSVNRLVLEIDPVDMRLSATRQNLPGDDTLRKFADADTLEQIIEYAEYMHLPAHTVLRMRPMSLTALLSLPYPVAKRVYEGKRGVDDQLARKALARRIPVHGLETVDEQMAVLNALEQGRETKMLHTIAYQRRDLLASYDHVVEAYVTGEVLAYFHKSMELYDREDPAYAQMYIDKMILGRNKVMVERAEKHLKAGKALIAVGALHIPGRGGILDLLADRGYQVTKLK